MKFDGIIFDLDGTLWDSTAEVAKTWTSIIAKYNLKRKEVTVEDLKPCMGKLLDEIASILLPELDAKMQLKVIKECCEYENEYLRDYGATLYDKLEDTLKELSKNYKLFIVSNCQDGYIECFFKAHKLDKYFIDYECPGRTGLPKGENIKLIVERNNLKNPVYVGDTQGDANAAKFANVPFIFAKYGFGNVEEFYNSIDSFDQLLKII
ncbi:HAD family hydrolase [Clostridium sp. 1001271B_151109_B4]|uniref:HAD family hydrolase n=1 Tax=Clostridium sp. 1001271B_151109_B4 TaxID=2787148 RepID=UPI0018AB9E81|nr:HAD family hydrolase [Clostridium sp. 1001271B_151109_B4]